MATSGCEVSSRRSATGNISSVGHEFADVEAVRPAIRLELYRANVGAALELAQAGYDATGDERIVEFGSFFAAVTKPSA